jgi:hypothetical protein
MVDNKKLRLTGVGLLRYWEFKAYTGAFYLEEETPVKDFLTDRTKRIELEYFRSIKKCTSIVNFLQKEGYDVNNLQRLQHSKRQETQ